MDHSLPLISTLAVGESELALSMSRHVLGRMAAGGARAQAVPAA